MYSYEDRIRAVELYIRFGKRLTATVRQLGYGTTKSLERWYQKYTENGDLPRSHIITKPRYSPDQKKAATDHYLSHGRCLAATVKALGYPVDVTLAGWLDELHPERKIRLVSKAAGVRHEHSTKQDAVIDLCTRQSSAQAVAQKIGVCRETLYKWQNQLLGPEIIAAMKPHNDRPLAPERADLEKEVETLRRDIRKLQLEHDILKKANELLKKGLGVDLELLSAALVN